MRPAGWGAALNAAKRYFLLVDSVLFGPVVSVVTSSTSFGCPGTLVRAFTQILSCNEVY